MTYLLTTLALFALGGIGWQAGRRRTTATIIATRVLLLAGVVAILTADGGAQQVAAGGLVGLVVGDLVAGLSRRDLAPPVSGERAP